jgi:hypothetical protein
MCRTRSCRSRTRALVVEALAQAHKAGDLTSASSYVEKGGMIAYQSDLD